MKKIILPILAWCFSLAGLHGGTMYNGALTISLVSRHQINCQSSSDINFARRIISTRDGERHVLILTYSASQNLRQEFSFILTPRATGMVNLIIGAAKGSRGIDPWFRLNYITAPGAELQNGSFSELNEAALPQGWHSTPKNWVHAANDRSTTGFLRVNYSYPIEQRLILTRGHATKFTINITPGNSANILATAKNTTPKISYGRLTLIPSFENCSVYVNRFPDEPGTGIKPRIFFREVGTMKWQQAMPLVDIPRENAWRGSIFRLKENTAYELEIEFKGSTHPVIRRQFRTLNTNFRVVRNLDVKPNSRQEGVVLARSGNPQRFVRYISDASRSLHAKFGTAVVWARDLRYVIIDRLKINAQGRPTGLKLTNCSHVIIRNCEIFNFQKTGIDLSNSSNILIERCIFHHPVNAHAAIMANDLHGGVVIRYNDFIADDQNRFSRAIATTQATEPAGGLFRDCDIHGNYFGFAQREALMLGGGGMNLRVYLNRFEGGEAGTNTGCCQLGPIYLVRNLYRNIAQLPFRNSSTTQGAGAIYHINNTIVSPPDFDGQIADAFHLTQLPRYNPPLKGFWRNNLIWGGSGLVFAEQLTKWNCDLDNEMLYFATPEVAALNRQLFAKFRHGYNNIYAQPRYISAERGNFKLDLDSPGRNAAARLPNLGYQHIGAFQDDRIKQLPHRPIPVATDRQEINFSSGMSGQINFELQAGRLPCDQKFQVIQAGNFFSVSPQSGTLKSHGSANFAVTLKPEKIKRSGINHGALCIRFADGFSCPVSIYAFRPLQR